MKIVQGTFRPDRVKGNAPAVPPGCAEPPEWLSERAAELFAGLSAILDSMGLATPVDALALALLASRLEEVEVLTAAIEDQGRTYQSDSGLWKARPEVVQRSEAMRHAHALLVEFGLTAAARSKVAASIPEAENPFKQFDTL
ncbi:phage terminase small subunit P27 family [Marimonas lutisalis]|uniref:phage terminase small subunit P27 family n=1 Tax=Marimonas lutisalis TaxID=2545756 RepID=UPI001375E7F0|nr:phage terminase small subunit P27 family [Marimonas lutisalis]